MSYSDRYPLTKRDSTRALRDALAVIPDLPEGEAADIARSVNVIADLANDLNDIFSLLVRGEATTAEKADLLSAFEMTLEQIRGRSDLIDGKLYDLSDRIAASGTERSVVS